MLDLPKPSATQRKNNFSIRAIFRRGVAKKQRWVLIRARLQNYGDFWADLTSGGTASGKLACVLRTSVGLKVFFYALYSFLLVELDHQSCLNLCADSVRPLPREADRPPFSPERGGLFHPIGRPHFGHGALRSAMWLSLVTKPPGALRLRRVVPATSVLARSLSA